MYITVSSLIHTNTDPDMDPNHDTFKVAYAIYFPESGAVSAGSSGCDCRNAGSGCHHVHNHQYNYHVTNNITNIQVGENNLMASDPNASKVLHKIITKSNNVL